MRIKITAGGIYGAEGEVAIGTEVTLAEVPEGWEGRYTVIDADDTEGKEPITNDDGIEALRARYLELTKSKADGRWNAVKLAEAIKAEEDKAAAGAGE